MEKKKKELEPVIEYYYNPNVPCTCEGLFADTHRNHCKRRCKESAEKWLKLKQTKEDKG